MSELDYIEANRKAWNEAERYHNEHSFEELKDKFKQPGYSTLDRKATALLKKVGLQGKSVAQLCCNNGREMLSVKNMGAAKCAGFDLSDAFIAQAKNLSAASGIDCDFYQGDVNQIPVEFHARFDLIYISVGTLGWMPDIGQFFKVLCSLLKPGGEVLIYEMHPILDMFDEDDTHDPPQLKYSYFKTEPFVENSGLDYLSETEYESETMYWFSHNLSAIFQAALSNALTIQHFEEYPHDVSSVFASFTQKSPALPLSYTLMLRRMG